jgi:hypothetical protein
VVSDVAYTDKSGEYAICYMKDCGTRLAGLKRDSGGDVYGLEFLPGWTRDVQGRFRLSNYTRKRLNHEDRLQARGRIPGRHPLRELDRYVGRRRRWGPDGEIDSSISIVFHALPKEALTANHFSLADPIEVVCPKCERPQLVDRNISRRP